MKESLETIAFRLSAELYEKLQTAQNTVSTAESCTGGMIGAYITSMPGSSSVYPGGVIVYCNEQKNLMLGVDQELLNNYGAVSEQVAEAMAVGCRKRFNTTYSVAVTGIAGPGGSTDVKPVGLVYIAVASASNLLCEKCNFSGGRSDVRLQTVIRAFEILMSL